MSGEQQRSETPQGPPWSLDLVADLHAGVLDQETADELLPRIQADPEASELLAALEATSAELADLPAPAVPDDVAARLDDALEAELRSWSMVPEAASSDSDASSQDAPRPGEADRAPVIDLAAARDRRRRRAGWTAGLITAAAAVTGIVVLGVSTLGTGGSQQAGQAENPAQDGPPPLALHGSTLPANRLGEALGSEQYGTLADPAELIGCLQANGVTSGNPLGAREVTINGEPGRALVLQGGGIGRFRILIVGQDCGPDRPATISDSTLGG